MIFKGTDKINKIKLGNTNLIKIYSGNSIVFQSQDTPPITGTIQELWIDAGLATWTDTTKTAVKFNNTVVTVPSVTDGYRLTSCSLMFMACTGLTTVGYFDTSNVTDMTGMFGSCTSLVNAPELNTSNVTNFASIYSGCINLVNVPYYDTSAAQYVQSMYNRCSSIVTIPLIDMVSHKTSENTNQLLYQCTNLVNCQVKNLNQNLDVSGSPSLSKDSVIYIFNNAQEVVRNTYTITLHTSVYNQLSASERAIATDKGFLLTSKS